MGLNAIVYKNASAPKGTEGASAYQEETLENADPLPAIHTRLGNASMIASLAEEVSQLDTSTSILSDKVLYSGSHSGDTVDVADLEKLQSEIEAIGKMTGRNRSAALETFLREMSKLIKTAREEQNPIVFV